MTRPTADQLAWLSATDLARCIADGSVSARTAVQGALARIDQHNPSLNAVTEVFPDEALEAADAIDTAGPVGPLAGVPILVKDEFELAGHVLSLGGYGNSTPESADSEVIRRVRAAGAIIVGTTAMPEFGQFPVTESRRYGRTHNPWDISRSPGGSSGGSAAAVAAGMVPIALGADGGGSLRIPASSCGIIGLKPTRGLVSTAPLPQYWKSLASKGGLSRSVADSALLMDVIVGGTDVDLWHWPAPDVSFTEQVSAGVGPLRIAWTPRSILPGLRNDDYITRAVTTMAGRLAGLGHQVERWTRRLPAPADAFLPQYYAGMRDEMAGVEHPERLERRTTATVALSG